MESDDISLFRIINANDFEKFVLTILENEARKFEKELLINEPDSEQNLVFNSSDMSYPFDAVAPEGIYNDTLTFIEVKKLNILREKSLLQVRQTINRFEEFLKNNRYFTKGRRIKLLIVTNAIRTTVDRIAYDFRSDLIEIWSIERLINVAINYPVEYNAIIELAISLQKSSVGSEKLRRISLVTSENDIKRQNDRHIFRLCKAMKNNGVSLVLGTGISMDYNNNLSWDALANGLYNDLPSTKKFDDPINSLSILGGENLSKAHYAKSNLVSSYSTSLYRLLYPFKNAYVIGDKSLDECAELICRGSINNVKLVNKVITYNYDNYLEQALYARSYTFNSLYRESDYLNKDFPIYHVHGYMPEGISADSKERYAKTIVLSEEDYFECYSDPLNWRVAIQLSTFKDDVCLFVGNSITDFNEKRLLRKTFGTRMKPHFAIFYSKGLSPNDLTKLHMHFYYMLNIKIIWVDSYSAIPDIIRTINNRI